MTLTFKNDGIRIHRKGGKEVVVILEMKLKALFFHTLKNVKKTEAVAGHEEALFLSLRKKTNSV